MARVNVEDKLFGDQRVKRLARIMKWSDREVIGTMVALWHESQEHLNFSGTRDSIIEWSWLEDDLVQGNKFVDAMVKVGFLHLEGDKFVIHGNFTQINNRMSNQLNSSKGGKATKERWEKIKSKNTAVGLDSGYPSLGQVDSHPASQVDSRSAIQSSNINDISKDERLNPDSPADSRSAIQTASQMASSRLAAEPNSGKPLQSSAEQNNAKTKQQLSLLDAGAHDARARTTAPEAATTTTTAQTFPGIAGEVRPEEKITWVYEGDNPIPFDIGSNGSSARCKLRDYAVGLFYGALGCFVSVNELDAYQFDRLEDATLKLIERRIGEFGGTDHTLGASRLWHAIKMANDKYLEDGRDFWYPKLSEIFRNKSKINELLDPCPSSEIHRVRENAADFRAFRYKMMRECWEDVLQQQREAKAQPSSEQKAATTKPVRASETVLKSPEAPKVPQPYPSAPFGDPAPRFAAPPTLPRPVLVESAPKPLSIMGPIPESFVPAIHNSFKDK